MRRRTDSFALAGVVILAAGVSGCMVGPDFHAPWEKLPDEWLTAAPPPATQPATRPAAPRAVELAEWWVAFGDPNLTALVARAVEDNLDVRLAAARIRQARAARGVAVAALGPAVDASGSYSRGRGSGAGAGNRGVKPPVTNLNQLGFDAAWEIDVFGGVRRGVEAADADLLAAVESRRDVLVSLTAEVAADYVALRAYQQRIAIARRNLAAQQRSAALTRKRFEGGFVSRLDVANADAQVATTTAQIPALEGAARQTIYSLSFLLGRPPGALLEELSPTGGIPFAAPAVPIGVPSDLLRRRPDVRQAEASIHAATARIGVATADLYPRVTIGGGLGWQAANTNLLFHPLSLFWSFGPSVSWQVFSSGRILSNIEVQKALQEQTILAYRQTVLAAMQEVENALIASAREQERHKALTEAVTANRKAVELATQLYTQGRTDFLNVLSAQQSLLATEDALAQSDAALATDLIALFKALGGGWQPFASGPTEHRPGVPGELGGAGQNDEELQPAQKHPDRLGPEHGGGGGR